MLFLCNEKLIDFHTKNKRKLYITMSLQIKLKKNTILTKLWNWKSMKNDYVWQWSEKCLNFWNKKYNNNFCQKTQTFFIYRSKISKLLTQFLSNWTKSEQKKKIRTNVFKYVQSCKNSQQKILKNESTTKSMHPKKN